MARRGRTRRTGESDVPTGELLDAAAGPRRRRRRQPRRCGPDPGVDRRCGRHRQPDVPQHRRPGEPAREPGGHRHLGQCGRHHRRAARGAAHHAPRRGPGSGAGVHHQPAQRRGQGQPVLPAGLQSRSRFRLRHHAGRRADERVVRCACPRVQRREPAHSRARQRRAVHQGAVLCRAWRLLRRRLGQHQLRERARPSVAERQQRRPGVGAHVRRRLAASGRRQRADGAGS